MREAARWSLLLLLVAICAERARSVATDPLVSPRYALSGAAAGGHILFAGGNGTVQQPSADVDIYVLRGRKYSSSLSYARMDLAGAGTDTTVIFAGGFGRFGVANTADIYDTVSETWSVSQLSTNRSLACGAAANSRIIFAGGGSPGGALATADVYNTLTKSWLTPTSISVPRYAMACSGAGTKIVFAGGYDDTSAYRTADIYDTLTDTWSSVADALSSPRYLLAAASAEQKIVFSGGVNAAGVSSAAVEIYDAATGTWTLSRTSLSVPRYFHAGAGALDKVFFAGGTNGSSALGVFFFGLFDIYDVNLDLWFTSVANGGPFLVEPRFRLAAAAAESILLYAGGVGLNNTISTNVDLIFSCRGLPPSTPAICIAGVWILPANVTRINATAGQPISVNGSLDLPPTAVIIVTTTSNTSSSPVVITVNGTANIDGTLTIVLTDVPAVDTLIPLLGATGINGSFNTIEVKSPPSCVSLSATEVYDASRSSLSALVSVDNSGCKKKKGLSGAAIAGIILGVLILFVIVGIVGGYLLMKHCRAAKPLFRKARTRAQTYSTNTTDV